MIFSAVRDLNGVPRVDTGVGDLNPRGGHRRIALLHVVCVCLHRCRSWLSALSFLISSFSLMVSMGVGGSNYG